MRLENFQWSKITTRHDQTKTNKNEWKSESITTGDWRGRGGSTGALEPVCPQTMRRPSRKLWWPNDQRRLAMWYSHTDTHPTRRSSPNSRYCIMVMQKSDQWNYRFRYSYTLILFSKISICIQKFSLTREQRRQEEAFVSVVIKMNSVTKQTKHINELLTARPFLYTLKEIVSKCSQKCPGIFFFSGVVENKMFESDGI